MRRSTESKAELEMVGPEFSNMNSDLNCRILTWLLKFQIRFRFRKQLFFSPGIAKFKQSTLALHFLKAGIPAGTEA